MAETDRSGSETAYQGADRIGERDETESIATVPTFTIVYVVACRLGVYLLHKFSTSMENSATVATVTTDKYGVKVANQTAAALSCFPSSSPATNANPSPRTSPSSSSSPIPSPNRTPSACPSLSISPSPKKENAVRDYFKLWVRVVVVYEVITVSMFVVGVAFGLPSVIGLLPSKCQHIESLVTACTYEFRLWNQLWRWRKDLLKFLGRGLRASVARLICVARGAGRIIVIVLSATRSGIVGAVGFLMTRLAQRWETIQCGNNNNADDNGDSSDEEPNSEPAPPTVKITEPPSAIKTSDNTTPTTCGLPETNPEIDTDHLAQKRPDRSCRSPTCTVPPETTPRTPPQQRAGTERVANEVHGGRDSALGSFTRTKNGVDATDTTNNAVNLTSRRAADQGNEIHCCTADPQARKEMWVRAQYFEDMDGEAVPGVFAYLPVTVLRPSYSEFSKDQGLKWYVQPGGMGGRKEWSEEDWRVIWEVPQAIIFDKVSAEPGERCDVCRRPGRQCSWTPDKLECLCDYCADAPRRHLDGCGHARDLGFNWARACDCLGQ